MLSEQKVKGVGRRLTQPSRGVFLVTESPTLDDSDSPAARRRQMAVLGTEVDEEWQPEGESLIKSKGELENAPQLSSVQSLVTL